ncbi:MAG: hydrogenase maturation protease [Bacteroidetes bacterium]|nr:hydrogenase maturation protease [Bacteroidota bacterium]
MKESNILILGVGNYLMGDEGLGVHVARALKDESLPEGVDVLDGGTAGFQLMEYLEKYQIVIMIDATLDKNPVGTIRLIEPKFSQDFPKAMSTHEIGLKDLVESLALLGKLPKIYLYVMTVQDIANLHIGLSPLVESRAIHLKRDILQLAEELCTTAGSPV